MISASGKPRHIVVSVGGVPITTFSETAYAFRIGEDDFTIRRRGLFAPDMELWRGDDRLMSVHKVENEDKIRVARICCRCAPADYNLMKLDAHERLRPAIGVSSLRSL